MPPNPPKRACFHTLTFTCCTALYMCPTCARATILFWLCHCMNLVAVTDNLMKVIGRQVSTLSSEVWVQVELRNLFALCDNELLKIVRVYISKHLRPCTFDQIVVKFEIQKVYKRVFPLVSCSSIHLALCPGPLQAASNQTLKPVMSGMYNSLNSGFAVLESSVGCHPPHNSIRLQRASTDTCQQANPYLTSCRGKALGLLAPLAKGWRHAGSG